MVPKGNQKYYEPNFLIQQLRNAEMNFSIKFILSNIYLFRSNCLTEQLPWKISQHSQEYSCEEVTPQKHQCVSNFNAGAPMIFSKPIRTNVSSKTTTSTSTYLFLLNWFYFRDTYCKKVSEGNGAIFYCRGFSQTGLFCFKTCSMMLGYSTTDPKVCQEAGIVKRNGLKTIYLRI